VQKLFKGEGFDTLQGGAGRLVECAWWLGIGGAIECGEVAGGGVAQDSAKDRKQVGYADNLVCLPCVKRAGGGLE
jgi:hypothetical protein